MIKVTPASKLSKALQLHPDVLDYIVSLNPHDFERLYNPLMRKLLPQRITIARLAQMTNMPLFPVINHAKEGDVILLKHRWEPQPLYDVWQKLNIQHFAIQAADNEWWIYLRKGKKYTQARRRSG